MPDHPNTRKRPPLQDRESQVLAGSLVLGLGLGLMLRRRRHRTEFAGRTVLVTGGSRGLGLELVREFSRRGARVVFCARHADEVSRAEAELDRQGHRQVYGMVCDVSHPEGPARLCAEVTSAFGAVDILVNNAGQIQVQPFVDSDETAFHRSLDLFLYGPLRLSQELLPAMMSQGRGAIVNVTSIGGLLPAPHLVSYNCGKAAMVALSEGMSVELDRYGIQVLTVKPGLMRTGGHRNAMFGGRASEEYAWFSRAAVSPALALSASSAARRVVDALAEGRRTVSLGWEGKWGPFFHTFLPETSHRLTSLIEKLLPAAGAAQPPLMGEIVAPEAPPLGPLLQRIEQKALDRHQAARYAVAVES